MKVSQLLARRIHSDIAVAIGLNERGETEKANQVLLRLDKVIEEQTVSVVDPCENCGFRRKVLEQKPE